VIPRDVLARAERAAFRLGVPYQRRGRILYLTLPDRELRLRASGGAGVIRAESYINDVLDATSTLSEDGAVALVERLATPRRGDDAAPGS
jgi:hypothetical protein